MKAPITVRELRGLARLGLALELEIDADGEFRRIDLDKTPFFWCPSAKAIVILRGTAVLSTSDAVDRRSSEAKARERWTHREASTAEQVRIPPVAGPWRALGRVARFDYWSDKWKSRGRREYTHRVESRVAAYAAGGKIPSVVVLKGGKLRIEWGGITG